MAEAKLTADVMISLDAAPGRETFRHADRQRLFDLLKDFRNVLVLSGLTTMADVETYPFRPDQVVSSVAELLDQL